MSANAVHCPDLAVRFATTVPLANNGVRVRSVLLRGFATDQKCDRQDNGK